jgi:hypothetical protein
MSCLYEIDIVAYINIPRIIANFISGSNYLAACNSDTNAATINCNLLSLARRYKLGGFYNVSAVAILFIHHLI